ncbi:MAG TPA: cysteine desulfurase [Nitrososphaerales archaeon]|nr:cysteine desulfurase [Nitrososphaerales archaeon]
MLEAEKETAFNVSEIRNDFPILQRKVHLKRLVYLDNAATTQKPKQVIDAISHYYLDYNSNIHRSVHELAERATEAFEASRGKVAQFISSPSAEEIIFTRNATEALNLAAHSLSRKFLKNGDKIVVTEMEHHSNFVPWQQLAKIYGASLEIVETTKEGLIDESDFASKIKGTRIFAFTQMSNVLGTINNAKELTKIAHEQNDECIVVVDGAQSVPHLRVDVKDIGCDFLAFSAHKMLGPTGVGCLFGRRELLELMPPFLLGGDMIRQVHRQESEWNDVPWKFEAGTSNIADVIGFGAAIDYIESKLGMNSVRRHEERICEIALDELQKVPELKLYGPEDPRIRGAVFSFNLGKIHAHDVASILDNEGVAIRSGHHCAQIMMEKLQVPATSRASFYVYNDVDDLEVLISALRKVREVLS